LVLEAVELKTLIITDLMAVIVQLSVIPLLVVEEGQTETAQVDLAALAAAGRVLVITDLAHLAKVMVFLVEVVLLRGRHMEEVELEVLDPLGQVAMAAPEVLGALLLSLVLLFTAQAVVEEVKAVVLPEELEATVVVAMAVCLVLQMEVQEQLTPEVAAAVEADTPTPEQMAEMAVLALLLLDIRHRGKKWHILQK
jgi:hypothetical protein